MRENNLRLIYSQAITVRWQDMDAFSHINHTNYFVYMQECRIEWLKSHNIFMDPTTRGPVISEISCKYLRPITYPANIIVELYFSHKSGRRIHFVHVIRDADNPEIKYAKAEATSVWVDFSNGKSIPEPEEYHYLLD